MRRGEEDMKYLIASLLLALVVSVSASLPAAAEAVRERSSERWSEGVRFKSADRTAHPQRRVSHHRSYRKYDRASRSHYAKRRHARVARHARRSRLARKPGISRGKIVQQRKKPAERAASAPVITKPEAAKPEAAKPEANKSAGNEAKKRGTLGMASYYWQPQALASGGRFNPNELTAAHKTLPFGTRVRVTHLGNGRSVEVKINDRGPYIAGRIIDLSRAAAGVIGMTAQGVARVAVEVLGK
jgi:peptidoglycan lytic transglycosylase